jgi:tetratricopeptide (TPR) repeat protein
MASSRIEGCSMMPTASKAWKLMRCRIWVFALLAIGLPGASSAQTPREWVGKRVITKFGAVLQVDGRVIDNEKLENTPRGGQRAISRIYRVEQANSPWLWIQDEESGIAGWVTADWLIAYDQAIDYFTNQIRANPANDAAYMKRGHIWKDRKEYDIALADYSEAIRLSPGNEAHWVSRGNAWSDYKEYDKAIDDYSEAIRLEPRYALAYQNRGHVWSAKKEYDRAIDDYDQAIRLDPKFALAYQNRGVAWRVKRNYDRAIADYNQAIRLDPKDASVYHCRGNAWGDKKEYDRAIADYNQAILLDPKDALAYRNRGITYYSKKEYEKSIADFDEVIRLDPKDALAYNGRGNAWSAKKEYERAIADFDQAIRLDSKSTYPHFNRSVAWMILRRAEAGDGFKTVLELEQGKGGHSTYAVILGHLAAKQTGNEADARWFLDQAAQLDASAWPFPVVKFLRGELNEVGLLTLAVDDKRTVARCVLGLDQLLRGHKDEALAHFRWVRDHGTTNNADYTIALAELDRLGEP